MIEENELAPYLLTIKEWENWLIRAFISVCLLISLAIIIKYKLIEPYSIRFQITFCDISNPCPKPLIIVPVDEFELNPQTLMNKQKEKEI